MPGTPVAPASRPNRRAFALGGSLVAIAVIVASGAVATVEVTAPSIPPGGLTPTPSQQEGPFYPLERPIDSDSDLGRVEGATQEALGEVFLLDGSLLRADGSPVEGAVVEIWQTDHQGIYLHPGDPDFAARDENFQGFGESTTDASGMWSFRTILPDIYGGRPRHIHAKVRIDGQDVLTTQIYFSGGDIPGDGSVEQTGSELDLLMVEALRVPADDGSEILGAQHVIVLPLD